MVDSQLEQCAEENANNPSIEMAQQDSADTKELIGKIPCLENSPHSLLESKKVKTLFGESKNESNHRTVVPQDGPSTEQMLSGSSADFEQTFEVTLGDIRRAHAENNLELNLSQIRSTRDYLQKVQFTVPLDKLYEITAGCYDNEGAMYCGLLVRIVDKTILGLNGDKPYLLQVWRKGGLLVFEKALEKPVCNWNISQDKFLYQEDESIPEIFLVCLYDQKQPRIYQFQLPRDLSKDRYQREPELSIKKFVITRRNTIHDDSFLKQQTQALAQKKKAKASVQVLGLDFSESLYVNKSQIAPEMKSPRECQGSRPTSQPSVSELFSDKIIKRAPAKMCNFIHGYIVLAYSDLFVYFRVVSALNNVKQDEHEKVVVLGEQDINMVELQKEFRIVCLQRIGDEDSCAVLEHQTTREVRFLQLKMPSIVSGQLTLLALGVPNDVNEDSDDLSPMLKYRGAVRVDENTGNFFYVGIVLRMNGRCEVYFDFTLVDQFYKQRYQCVDIESGGRKFYFKMVKNSHLVDEDTVFEQLQFKQMRARHSWKNRIGSSTVKPETKLSNWNLVMHASVADYVSLYSQMLNFSTFMIVAHRNMISLYDMGSRSRWVDTIQLATNDHIRFVKIKKRPKYDRQVGLQHTSTKSKQRKQYVSILQKYELACLVGSCTLKFVKVVSRGNGTKFDRNFNNVDMKARILTLVNDKYYRLGMLMLTDDIPTESDFSMHLDCSLYTYPLGKRPVLKDPSYKLTLVKKRQCYDLLNNTDVCTEGLLTAKVDFCIARANRYMFEAVKDDFDQGENSEKSDAVKDAYADSEFVEVLILSAGDIIKHFPIYKTCTYDGRYKQIEKIQLITEKQYTRTYISQAEQTGNSMQDFFASYEEFGADIDSYIKVTRDALHVFAKDQTHKMTISGLNFLHALNIHQRFVYASTDIIHKPIQIVDHTTGETSLDWSLHKEGIYVFSLQALLRGCVESYKLGRSLGGICNQIDYSLFGERLSFMSNYETITVMPLPHLNLINFIGMGNKKDQLIWREKKGFFTSLNRNGDLQTWSILTGKLLYTLKPDKVAQKEALAGYEVYRSDNDDITFTRRFYNQESRSLNLLKSSAPIERYDQVSMGDKVNLVALERMLSKMKKRNLGGLANFAGKSTHLASSLFSMRVSNTQVNMINSSLKFNLYHFKVMELSTFEDNARSSECRVLFHFMHRLIAKRDGSDDLHDVAAQWDLSVDPRQRLYLSQDTGRMMEVINNTFAIVYKRHNIDENGRAIGDEYLNFEEDQGQQVKWKTEFKIMRFPSLLCERTSAPFIFSPNFTFQLDFSYSQAAIVVLRAATQEIYMKIRTDMINMDWSETTDDIAIQLIFSRMRWENHHSERRLRIATQHNLDCLFEMSSHDPEDKDPSQRYLKLISVSKIDNLHTDSNRMDSPHFYQEPFTLNPRDVIERILRMNQNYKVNLQHACNLGLDKGQFSILEQIHQVDYLQNWDMVDSEFLVEKSFTQLDWLIMDKAIEQNNFDLRDVEDIQKLQLAFNILPDGKGILHELATHSSNSGKTGKESHAYFIGRDLFDVTKQKMQAYLINVEEDLSFEIPVLQDAYGLTALDICLGIRRPVHHPRSYFAQPSQREIEENKSAENLLLANLIFENIKDYGMMHHSHQIMDAIIVATSIGLSGARVYLGARMHRSKHPLISSSQPSVKSKFMHDFKDGSGSYGVLQEKVFGPTSDITDTLFEANTPLGPTLIQTLDLPGLHTRTPQGDDFMKALSLCEDLNFFLLKSVQIIIEEHSRQLLQVYLWGFGLPVILWLFLFWYWKNIVVHNLQTQSDLMEDQHTIIRWVLTILTCYLLIVDLSQLLMGNIKRIFDYLISTVVGITAPVLVLVVMWRAHEIETEGFWRLLSWTALLVWVRFALWMRSSRRLSWMLTLIVESISTMMQFMLVFLSGIFAFADAFRSIERILMIQGKVEERPVTPDMNTFEAYLKEPVTAWQKSFLVALGEFHDELEHYPAFDWVVFFLAAFFNLIVMLNLLISIISETYTNISESRLQTSYKEKAMLIHQRNKSFLGFIGRKIFDPSNTLYLAQVLNTTSELDKDDPNSAIIAEIEDLHTKLEDMESRLVTHVDDRLFKLAIALVDKLQTTQNTTALTGDKQILQTISEQPNRPGSSKWAANKQQNASLMGSAIDVPMMQGMTKLFNAQNIISQAQPRLSNDKTKSSISQRKQRIMLQQPTLENIVSEMPQQQQQQQQQMPQMRSMMKQMPQQSIQQMFGSSKSRKAMPAQQLVMPGKSARDLGTEFESKQQSYSKKSKRKAI